tara:strand:+ start:307 stop:408 length:102 start_codon:yes stop_codon:yes gene_type:complete
MMAALEAVMQEVAVVAVTELLVKAMMVATMIII